MNAGERPERLRIAWIVPGFEGGPDEPGVPALGMLAEWLAHRYEVQVYTVRFPERAAEYHIGAVAVRSFGYREDPGSSPVRRRIRSAHRWACVLSAIAADHRAAPFAVVHGLWATEPGMLAVAAGRLLGLPSLVSAAGGELASVRAANYGGRLRRTERAQTAAALHMATAIGVGSADTRRRLLLRYPWLHARIRTLPLSFSPTIFGPLLPTPQPGRVVCVASWAPVKGHALLAAATRILLERDIPIALVLIGERTDGLEARAALKASGLAAHVRTLGAVSQTVVADELQQATVLVLASWHEAQCLAIVEALACGVPVVATPVGVARELLHDPRIGTIVPRRDPELLADALSAYMSTAARGDEQRAARHHAVASYALPVVGARFVAVYEAIKRQGRPRGPAPAVHRSTCSRVERC